MKTMCFSVKNTSSLLKEAQQAPKTDYQNVITMPQSFCASGASFFFQKQRKNNHRKIKSPK